MKLLYRVSLILNLVLLIAIILQFIFFPSYFRSKVKEITSKHSERKKTLYEALPNSEGEIIFLGASLIEGANWDELFQNPKIKNRGISGEKTTDILMRLDEVIASKPAKIFLMVGQNDINANIPTNTILENYGKILQRCREKSSKTQLYIHTLTPILYELHGKAVKNEEMIIFNGKLKSLAQKYEAFYIDIFTPLVGNKETNELDIRYTNDGEHLNAAGYTRWKALIEQYVNE